MSSSKMIQVNVRKEYKDESQRGVISFLNPASIGTLLKEPRIFEGVSFYIDGIVLSIFLSILSGKKIQRTSFDFTSIANTILNNRKNNERGFFFIGGSALEIRLFVDKVLVRFSDINVRGCSHGYLDQDQEQMLVENIAKIQPAVVIVGMGAGKQENFSKRLIEQGLEGQVFTCGAFISQESTNDTEYYPYIMNKLNLRFLFRMYKEPHTIKRYLLNYPLNLAKLIYLIALGKIVFNIK